MAKKAKQGDRLSIPPGWGFKVISEYEFARSLSAISEIVLRGKPIAEVMTRRAKKLDLEADLRKVIDRSGMKAERIRFWIWELKGGICRYGFYREAWALRALDFLRKTTLSPYDNAWISGLVFGYDAREIQKFITKKIK